MRGVHNIEYHRLILAAVPPACVSALDVGCEEGLLARRLAGRCQQVTGLDVDAQVIATAATVSPQCPNVTFAVGDIMTCPLQPAAFNFLSTVATLHHLPLKSALVRFDELLAPGGVLAIVGLYRPQGMTDTAFATAGFLASHAKRRFYQFEQMNAPMQQPQQTLSAIRDVAKGILPGSRLMRRLYFRYSLVWRKPIPKDQ